jgi:hypothetical protein
MIPLTRFEEIISATREQINLDLQELEQAAHLLGARPNYFTMDQAGYFHVQASGTIDECITALETHLRKLIKIKDFKEGRQ